MGDSTGGRLSVHDMHNCARLVMNGKSTLDMNGKSKGLGRKVMPAKTASHGPVTRMRCRVAWAPAHRSASLSMEGDRMLPGRWAVVAVLGRVGYLGGRERPSAALEALPSRARVLGVCFQTVLERRTSTLARG